MIKSDLWFIGNCIMGLLDLFFGVNQQTKTIKFQTDFVTKLKELEKINNQLKDELKNHPRSKRWL